jgi:hypothetical protein
MVSKANFNYLDNVVIVSSNEVKIKRRNFTRQKIVAATGNDEKTYYTHANLCVIGATMVRTKFYWVNYFNLMVKLYKTLYHIDYNKTPSRANVAKSINAVLKQWNKSTDGENKPLSHKVLLDKRQMEIIRMLVSTGIIGEPGETFY